MKRSDFVSLLKDRCTEKGYNFLHGFPYRMNEGTNKNSNGISYPLFWLCPMKLIGGEINGIESHSTYQATAYIHHLNNKFTEDQKEGIWQEQEKFAISLFTSLSSIENSDVEYVNIIELDPDEFVHKDGTISMEVTFKVRIYDCTE